MEINIRGAPKEIAALVLAVQGRRETDAKCITNAVGTITEAFQKATDDTEQGERTAW